MMGSAGAEFWRGALARGGATAVPRWSRDRTPAVARLEVPMDEALLESVQRLADDLGVPLRTALLAAHAVVLASLCGESDVTTRYVAAPGREPLPCGLTTAPATWRGVLLDAYGAEAGLLAHRDVSLDDLRRDLGLHGPATEVVFDPAGATGELPEDVVLGVGLTRRDDRTVLVLRHRTEAVDATAAERIAGYHLTALRHLADDPDAEHARASLLSEDERYVQLRALASRHRELPDLRCHELIEERVRMHPDAVAAVHGDRSWTYAELDRRANRIGRVLRAHGLQDEGVVAVVTERNLDWLASVLGIFKAGGVYLPIEPHFPADRIATTLGRAGCRLVLTEAESTASLDGALASLTGVEKILVADAYAEEHPDGVLGLPVAADQLAYIYFTSGSTGEPKGAMCEHAGLVNHLFAKIDDLGIGEGQVVAQTAPQCFDISLWQLVAALVVGGRTLLVEQEVVLDVERFVDTVERGRVAVLQVVPSYLEVVLTYLEQHPRELPDLRCVSATGEALKMELVQRWFAAQPGIPLVNAYGLTETSDDTNHAVLREAPDGDRVPLGPPVHNVRVYVVDDALDPVPLGAPGEIVFSGVCVGRGYVNDPERTRAAFVPDPHRPGERLYRSGDFGRWQPDGSLEFLGRRDTQVKISGFRMEIGEIENALLRVPGVRDGAVVVAQRGGRNSHLVAFYSGDRPLADDLLKQRLGASLPVYMVPPAFHWRERLPLTPNGKIDRKALTALAAEMDQAVESAAEPNVAADLAGTSTAWTPTEQRLAQAWASVLGVPVERIGRTDSFFDTGGSSLSAVKLAVALDRAVSLKDVVRSPVLADLARLVDDRSQTRAADLVASP